MLEAYQARAKDQVWCWEAEHVLDGCPESAIIHRWICGYICFEQRLNE